MTDEDSRGSSYKGTVNCAGVRPDLKQNTCSCSRSTLRLHSAIPAPRKEPEPETREPYRRLAAGGMKVFLGQQRIGSKQTNATAAMAVALAAAYGNFSLLFSARPGQQRQQSVARRQQPQNDSPSHLISASWG